MSQDPRGYTGPNPFDPHAFPFNCSECLTPIEHEGLCDDCFFRFHEHHHACVASEPEPDPK